MFSGVIGETCSSGGALDTGTQLDSWPYSSFNLSKRRIFVLLLNSKEFFLFFLLADLLVAASTVLSDVVLVESFVCETWDVVAAVLLFSSSVFNGYFPGCIRFHNL